MVRVKAPWVKCYYNVNGDTYIIPNIDTVVLGGTSTLSCAPCISGPCCMLSAVTSPQDTQSRYHFHHFFRESPPA